MAQIIGRKIQKILENFSCIPFRRVVVFLIASEGRALLGVLATLEVVTKKAFG